MYVAHFRFRTAFYVFRNERDLVVCFSPRPTNRLSKMRLRKFPVADPLQLLLHIPHHRSFLYQLSVYIPLCWQYHDNFRYLGRTGYFNCLWLFIRLFFFITFFFMYRKYLWSVSPLGRVGGRELRCLQTVRSVEYTGYTQKNVAVSKVNKEFISHITRAQRTPSAAATVQVSHALPAVRFSCLMRGRGASSQDGVAAGKGFLCAPFWGVQICYYSARNSRCTVITDLDTSKRSTQKAFSCCDAATH